MKDLKPTCRIAVVQAAPVLFDKSACTDKAVRLIAECARSGAELIVYGRKSQGKPRYQCPEYK